MMLCCGLLCRSWLGPVLLTTENDFMRCAGLDALMLLRTLTMGVQIFLPIAILSLGVCECLLPARLLRGAAYPHTAACGRAGAARRPLVTCQQCRPLAHQLHCPAVLALDPLWQCCRST